MNVKDTLKTAKLHESTISMILGAIVIVVVGVLLVNYFSGKSGQTIPPVEITDQSSEENTLPTTHKIAEGEDLWSISEEYYGTGYNWIDIAESNGISDPDSIKEGQELTIPDVKPRIAQNDSLVTPGQETTMSKEPTTTPKENMNEEPTPTKEPMPTPIQERSGEGGYTVKENDNLWKIAEENYGSGYNWVDIANANDLNNPGHIETGQNLVIPDVTVKQPTIAGTQKENIEPISGATYTVKSGDTLWEIALRAYGDGYRWTEIANENELNQPGLIHKGNTLSIPR